MELLSNIIKSETREGESIGGGVSLLQASDTAASLLGEYRKHYNSLNCIEDVQTTFPWNEEFSYPSILFDKDSIKKNQDQDKQEVLSQISELDASEMTPIISSCQLVLSILYARKLLVKIIHLSTKLDHLNQTSKAKESEPVSDENSKNDIFSFISKTPNEFISAIKFSFYQYIFNSKQKRDLFPFVSFNKFTNLYKSNTSTKEYSSVPKFSPFFTQKTASIETDLEGEN